jgi:hypothetical protein
MKVIAALLACLLLSSKCYACSCQQDTFSEKEAQAASRVFIFRLVDARIESDPPKSGYARNPNLNGNIRVVESLKGNNWGVKNVRFQNSSCCGIRLDVGHYFIVFSSQEGDVIDLSEELVVDINDKYFEGSPENYSEKGIVRKVNLMLRRELSLEDVLPIYLRKHISTAPPPPPPPPCPKPGK